MIVGVLKKMDLIKDELEEFILSGKACNFESLQLARLRASNTLLHNKLQVPSWNLALQTLSGWIQDDRQPTLDAIFEINRILLNASNDQSPVRRIALSAAGIAFPHPEQLEILLSVFKSEMEWMLENEHPVIQAAWVYQRLIGIHPFHDANGRTCRLAADWVLARSGFSPMVFLSPVAAMVPVDLEHRELKMQLTGVLRVANAIHTGAQILTMGASHQVLSAR